MQEFIIPRTKGPSLKFNGELLAEVDTRESTQGGAGKAQRNCYRRNQVYKTAGGNFVGTSVEVRFSDGSTSKPTAVVFKEPKDGYEFFGYGGIGRAVMEKAGLADFELVA